MAEKKHNIFISHYGEDERQLDSLKQRLRDHGCDIRNSSVEKKKYRPYKVTDATIARYLRICIRWAKTFIVMIGEHTHKRPWVNYEIRNAARQGKAIIGIYEHGTTTLGWNSVDKLIDVIEGRTVVSENPNGSASGPIQNIIRIKCN